MFGIHRGQGLCLFSHYYVPGTWNCSWYKGTFRKYLLDFYTNIYWRTNFTGAHNSQFPGSRHFKPQNLAVEGKREQSSPNSESLLSVPSASQSLHDSNNREFTSTKMSNHFGSHLPDRDSCLLNAELKWAFLFSIQSLGFVLPLGTIQGDLKRALCKCQPLSQLQRCGIPCKYFLWDSWALHYRSRPRSLQLCITSGAHHFTNLRSSLPWIESRITPSSLQNPKLQSPTTTPHWRC